MRNLLTPFVRRFVVLLLAWSFSGTCFAYSKLADAVIQMHANVPCFSIPTNSETRNGVPLYQVMVGSADPSLPMAERVYWHTWVTSRAGAPLLFPNKCIEYGATIRNGVNEVVRRLEPYQVYFAEVNARAPDSPIISYVAMFCLKPTKDGKLILQSVRRSNEDVEIRYKVCRPPP